MQLALAYGTTKRKSTGKWSDGDSGSMILADLSDFGREDLEHRFLHGGLPALLPLP
jgi:hypothetical protein